VSDQDGGEIVQKREDRRVLKTRAAIRSAFNDLILSRGYDAISAADVAEHADVGRSTFYEHYQSKDDVLAQSLIPVLEPLASTCLAQAPDQSLTLMIQHFWDNRRLAKALMTGRPRAIMARQLAGLIERRLGDGACLESAQRTAIPIALLAIQLAHGQLALLEEWLTGRYGCSATQITAALRATTHAAAQANFRA
jgi:AcrR family transcriptional regulator